MNDLASVDMDWLDDQGERFEQAWENGQRPDIGDYLVAATEGKRAALFRHLLVIELERRHGMGEMPAEEEYRSRFPEYLEVVDAAFVAPPSSAGAPEGGAGDSAVPKQTPAEPLSQDPDQTGPETPPEAPRQGSRWPTIPRYEILGQLGQGGMGVVYEALHLGLKRRVALKMIRAGQTTEAALTRFQTEALAVARLNHTNIVQVFEVGEFEGQPYCALEFVGGGSLSQRLKQEFPPREAAELVARLARSVHAVHDQRIVHRDLKPANILLQGDPRAPVASWIPKVSDFGLAKFLDEQSSALTQPDQIMGTPSYMAPEQAEGRTRDVTAAADIYALGAILYECLTGRPPFKGATVKETLAQVRDTDPVPPSRLQPKLPRDLETICLKCLEKAPHRRYATAQDLAEDLERFSSHRPIKARRTRLPGRVWRWCRRHPVPTAAAGIILAIAVTAIVLITRAWNDTIHMARLRDLEAQNATAAAEEALIEKNKAVSRLAHNAFVHARSLCELGNVNQGLLELARSLELSPPGEAGLERTIRANIAMWRPHCNGLLGVIPHGSPVLAVAVSPDGRWWLTGCADGTARGWDSRGEAFLPVPLRHAGPVSTVAISQDGTSFVTGTGTVSEPAMARGRLPGAGFPRFQPGMKRNLGEIVMDGLGAFRGIGRRSGAFGYIGSLEKGRGNVHILLNPVSAAAFNPNGQALLVAHGLREDDKPRADEMLWHLQGYRQFGNPKFGRPFKRIENDWTVLLPPGGPADFGDGAVVAFGKPQGLRIGGFNATPHLQMWDARKAMPLGSDLPQEVTVSAVDFSRDGKWFAVGYIDGTVRLGDARTGKLQGDPRKLAGPIVTVLFHPDSRSFLTAHNDRSGRGIVQNWVAPTLKQDDTFSPLVHSYPVKAAAYSPDGHLILTGSGTFSRRDEEGPFLGYPFVQQMVRQALARHSMSSEDVGEARFWDAATGVPVSSTIPHPGAVHAVTFAPNGQLMLTGCADGNARVWEVPSNPSHLPWIRHNRIVAMSSNGKAVVRAIDADHLQVVDAKSGEPLTERLPHQANIDGVKLRPDGEAFVIWWLEDEKIRAEVRWTKTGNRIGNPLQTPAKAARMTFSSDGNLVLVTLDGEKKRNEGVLLWNPLADQPVTVTGTGREPINAVAFSADGKRIALSSGNSLQILSVPNTDGNQTPDTLSPGERIHLEPGHRLPINALALSPDGRTILTGSADQTAQLWDATTGKALGQLPHQSRVSAVAFSRDGQLIVTGSQDGSVQLWEVTTRQAVGGPLQHESAIWFVGFGEDNQTVLSQTVGAVGRVWKLPAPVGVAVGAVKLWTEYVTGLELTPGGVVKALDADEWHDRLKLLSDSIQDGEKSLDIFTHPLAWHRHYADVAEARGQWFAAQWHLETWMTAEPRNWLLPARRSLALAQLDRLDEALADATQAIRLGGNEWKAWFNRGRLRCEMKRWDLAVDDFGEAFQRNGRNLGLLHYARGQARAELGRWEEAAMDFRDAAKDPEFEMRAQIDEALVCLRLGNREGFQGSCGRLLEAASKGKNVLLAEVAGSLSTLTPQGIDPQRLMNLAKGLAKDQPDLPVSDELLGTALYRQGQFAEAKEKLEAANALAGGEEPTLWLFLAMVHHHLNNAKEAESLLNKTRAWIGVESRRPKIDARGETAPWFELSWAERLELQLLFREAVSLVHGKDYQDPIFLAFDQGHQAKLNQLSMALASRNPIELAANVVASRKGQIPFSNATSSPGKRP